MKKSKLVLLTLLLLVPVGVDAQPLDPFEMVKVLSVEASDRATRSIVRARTQDIQKDSQLPEELELPKIEFQVDFVPHSHVLTVAGMKTLRRAALALNNEDLRDTQFQVAVHFHNARQPLSSKSISSRRARSIVEHLRGFYEIGPERLIPVGYGHDELTKKHGLNSQDMTYVEFINVKPLVR